MATEHSDSDPRVPPHLTTIVLEPGPNIISSSRPASISTDVDHERDERFPSTSTSTSSSMHTHNSNGLPGPLWTHRVSESFSAMAEQIAAASQAIALIPPHALPDPSLQLYSQQFSARLDEIEATQRRLEAEFSALKEQLGNAQAQTSTEVAQHDHDVVDDLKKQLEKHIEETKLE